uniref:Putative secreted protein n=1 Tax=Anopheles darlingi TaxID=43151 RepID=A0A2M4DPN6_ANODA
MRKRNTLRELFRSLFLISIHFDVLAIVTLLPSRRRRSSHTRRTYVRHHLPASTESEIVPAIIIFHG